MPVEGTDRQWPEVLATDELRLQWEFLSFLRATAVNKLAGLDRDLAASTPLETSPLMSLMAVVKHLTAVESFWISRVGGGVEVLISWEGPDPDADMRIADDDTPESIVEAYRTQWTLSEEAIAGMAPGDRTRRFSRAERTIRWVLTHLIQETARHVGHMDILREMADSERGE